MVSRRRSRQRAVQVLYLCDLRHLSLEEAVAATFDLLEQEGEENLGHDDFMEELARGTLAAIPDLDAHISRHSANWRVERMPAVDRSILRMAVFEMLQGKTQAPIVIDEAIELARRFSGEESVPVVNGVLDAVRKDLAAAEG